MVHQKIHLRKIRDLSDNLSDTFQFIRQEFKPLVKSFILIAGVFLLANSIMSGIYQKTAFGFLDGIQSGNTADETQLFSTLFTPGYFITIGLTWLSMLSMNVVVACYMKVYQEKNESPSFEEVWKYFARYFPKVIFFSIPQIVLVIIGLLLCLFPGIYLAFVFVPFQFIIVMEDADFSGAISRCFDIIKRNFWMSVGIYIVAYIIYTFSSAIIGFVVAAIVGVISYLTTKQLSTTVGIVMSVINIIGYAFYLVFLVSAFLNYCSLTESHDGTGLSERLETLGEKNDLHTNLEEEY
ncbi:MAG: hypothetical protein WAU24_07060 [Chitinophagaceae bacterium]